MSNQTITGPFEFIIGTNDLQRMWSFLRVFGFDEASSITIEQQAALELYGCVEAQSQLLLRCSATETVVRLVLTDAHVQPMRAFEAGGHGIDFYTTSITEAIERAAQAGGSRPSPVSWTIDTGRHLTEARIVSPDESFAVFCVSYSAGGVPTILDQDAGRLFSEVSLTSWIIPADHIEEEFQFWGRGFGYRNIRRTMLAKDAMVDLMKLPHAEAMGCSMFADDRPRCPVDLLWYPDRTMSRRDDWPLRPGLFALGFRGAGLQTQNLQSGALTTVQVRDSEGRTVTILAGRSPGGIRFHLHS